MPTRKIDIPLAVRMYFEEGKSEEQIAPVFGVYPASIGQALKAAGYTLRGQGEARTGVSAEWNLIRTPDLENQVRHLYLDEQRSPKYIAEAMGHSATWVNATLDRLGIPRRTRLEAFALRSHRALGGEFTKEQIELAMAEVEGNATECAKNLNIKYTSLIGICDRFGISRRASPGRMSDPLPSWINEAIELSKQHVLHSDIAAKYGVTYEKLSYLFRKVGHKGITGRPGVRDPFPRTIMGQKLRLKREFVKEGGWTCEVCGEPLHLIMAHIWERRDRGPMEKDNILILCGKHHDRFDKPQYGALTPQEFEKIKARVRFAEQKYKGRPCTDGSPWPGRLFYAGW
jgi:transposase-like protein